MIYEMGNFLCVLASIVIACIILLYPWGVTVLKINEFFSFLRGFSGKGSAGCMATAL